MSLRRASHALVATALLGLTAAGSTAVLGDDHEDRGRPPSAADGGRFVEVIVVLNPASAPGTPAANRAEAARFARGHGVAPRFAYGAAVFGFSASVPAGRLQALANHPRVAYIDHDAPVSIPVPRTAAPPWCQPGSSHPACGDGGDGEGGGTGQVTPWGVARIGADANPNGGGDANGAVHVYVIDSGVQAGHPDLAANLGNGYAAEACKGGRCRAAWDDDNGHGTHVAGTIGALDNDIGVVGVAPKVTLHAVKVLSKSGTGRRSGVIAGIDWVTGEVAARGQPAVANMSLGGSGSKAGTCSESGFSGADAYYEAICNAANRGVVFTVAAGNDGADAATSVPAAYDDAVITVTATSGDDDWPSWSNWGSGSAAWTARTSAPVAIAAPGANVLSTWNDGGTATRSGTSMAAPHVAGAVALYLKSNPQSTDRSAFTNARAHLLMMAESTEAFANTSGKRHDEDFLDAGGL